VSISARNCQRRVRVSLPRLRRLARRVLAAVGRSDSDVHVSVVGDRDIRSLHARYLGRRRATDVMAFNLDGGPASSLLLGEVVISADTALRQSRRVRVPVALEIDLLLVHGILHLAGWDDHTPADALRMHEREREILSAPRRRPIPERLWTGLLSAS
jgi:probable rRNA maturation factor